MVVSADGSGREAVAVGAGSGLVLVHGAAHTSACWAPTVAELARQAPDVAVTAVDLPGRGATPGDLRTATLDDYADAVVDRIDAAGIDEVALVAHSMSGLLVPGVVTRLGRRRVARLVFVAALVPPDGSALVDMLRGPVRWQVARAYRKATPRPPPPPLLARWLFCNGMTAAQREVVLAGLCEESTVIPGQTVTHSPLLASVPTTWILTRRDRMVRPRQQRASIANLAGVDQVVELDAGHDIMVSHPAALASILHQRHRP